MLGGRLVRSVGTVKTPTTRCFGRSKSGIQVVRRIAVPHVPQRLRPVAAAAGVAKLLQTDDLKSTAIDAGVLKKVSEAVKRLGNRASAGDVAGASGVSLFDAERALQALAADTLGHLEVREDGEVCYTLAQDFEQELQRKSWRLRLQPALTAAAQAAAYGGRVFFGVMLLASIAVVATALIVLATASSSDSDSGSGSGSGSSSSSNRSSSVFISSGPFDWWYWNPFRIPGRRVETKRDMNFFEAIYSVVFGDGDPNADVDDVRWSLIGEYIRSRDGVVAAEEIAPFLDLNAAQAAEVVEYHAPQQELMRRSFPPNEDFMLPVLLRFQGSPKVDDNGFLLYEFPALRRGSSPSSQIAAATSAIADRARAAASHISRWPQRRRSDGWEDVDVEYEATASTSDNNEGVDAKEMLRQPLESFVGKLEKPWKFTRARFEQVALVTAFGALNVLGVAALSVLLANPINRATLVVNGLGFVLNLMPALQAYAATFVVLPLLRSVLNARRNAEINERNEQRVTLARLVANPAQCLWQKLKAMAMQRRALPRPRESRIVLDTSSDLTLQLNELESRSFDKRLERF